MSSITISDVELVWQKSSYHVIDRQALSICLSCVCWGVGGTFVHDTVQRGKKTVKTVT